MKKLLKYLLVITLAFAPLPNVNAGWLPLAKSSSAYVGPGDVISGAKEFFSCARGYALASVGANACNICNVGDVVCSDVTVGANGKVTIPLIGGSDCSVVTCTVKIMYDQSGALNCSGGPCDLSNATIANRPTLLVNCVNSLACAVFLASGPQNLEIPFQTGFAQPYTFSVVAQRQTDFANFRTIVGDTANNQDLFWNGANSLNFSCGTTITNSSVADAAFHSMQAGCNGASGYLFVDGVSTTGNVGTGAMAIQFWVGKDGGGANGTMQLAEIAVYPSAFSGGQQTSINSNQHGTNGYNF